MVTFRAEVVAADYDAEPRLKYAEAPKKVSGNFRWWNQFDPKWIFSTLQMGRLSNLGLDYFIFKPSVWFNPPTISRRPFDL